MDWVCAQLDVEQFNQLTSNAWLISPAETLETFTDPTLMATRAYLAMRTTVTQVGGAGYIGIGLIAWDGTELISSADPPGPMTDCDFDWINRWVGVAPNGAPAGTFLNPNVFDNTHLSKARRRLPSGTGLLVCFQGLFLSGGVSAAIDVRCLIKE
jgi:hypothetical protein